MTLRTLAMRDAVGGYEWSAFGRTSFRLYDYLADRPSTFCVGQLAPVCLVLSGEVEFELGPSRRPFRVREGEAYSVLPGTPYFFRMKAGTRIAAVDFEDFAPPEMGIAVFPSHAIPPAVVAAFERAIVDRTPRRLEAAKGAAREITRRLSVDGVTAIEPGHNTARLVAVKRHLERTFTAPVSLASVAEQFGMDVSYLSRAFDENFGIPPSRYVFLLRAEAFLTRTMLGRRPLGRAAEESGVVDYPNFCRRFGKQFGRAPSRLMKREPAVAA